MSRDESDVVSAAHTRLENAVLRGRSLRYCRRLWATFVRLRDGNRCVDCHSTTGLSAHHIARKSFLPKSQLDTGNGITLCRSCHAEPHAAFNRKPDLTGPMDYEGGENIDLMERLYYILYEDARDRCCHVEAHYQLSTYTLGVFRLCQGLDAMQDGGGIPTLYQA
jgi:hypothetical protein